MGRPKNIFRDTMNRRIQKTKPVSAGNGCFLIGETRFAATSHQYRHIKFFNTDLHQIKAQEAFIVQVEQAQKYLNKISF